MQTMTNKKEKIAEIINTRRPLIKEIEEKQGNLRRTALAIRSLEDMRTQILKSGDAAFVTRIKHIDFSNIQQQIQVELGVLEKLKNRFSRPTLNIGVIGRARQGKSRLLQSLSGLTSNEIPDGDQQTCTGVRSTIYHHSVESYAEVVFYTEHEFIGEVLAPYYRELELGPSPSSIEQFALQPLPLLPKHLNNQVTLIAKYNHLKTYREHIDDYKALLKEFSPQRISLDQIRQFVAQDTLNGERIYHNYLAVREVRIYCNFPHSEDVGQLALLDMPGLGDTGIGDEERLVKALGEDIDVALFVRMPKPAGDHWAVFDTELYDTARLALKDLLPLHQWSFMVLNRTQDGHKGDNTKNCEALKASLPTTFAISSSSHAFVESIMANCSDPGEVNAAILEPALDYLLDNISKLDRQYADACLDELASLQKKIDEELEKAHIAFGTANSSDRAYAEFQGLFKKMWQDLTNGLETLIAELRKKRDMPHPVFDEYFKKKIEACNTDTGIPSVEGIKFRRNVVGNYSNVYNDCLDEIRTQLTYHFINLDDALKLSMSEVKREIADVFRQQGCLGALTGAKSDEFFCEMAEKIPPERELKRLKHTFRVFAKYELSYRGFFQHRIRERLDTLIPDRTTLKPAFGPEESTAEEVVKALRTVHANTVNDLQKELSNWLNEPSMAAFATVEELVDQTLRARDAIEEWRLFYWTVRQEVWSPEFKKIVRWESIQKDWLSSVENAQRANRASSPRFLS